MRKTKAMISYLPMMMMMMMIHWGGRATYVRVHFLLIHGKSPDLDGNMDTCPCHACPTQRCITSTSILRTGTL